MRTLAILLLAVSLLACKDEPTSVVIEQTEVQGMAAVLSGYNLTGFVAVSASSYSILVNHANDAVSVDVVGTSIRVVLSGDVVEYWPIESVIFYVIHDDTLLEVLVRA